MNAATVFEETSVARQAVLTHSARERQREIGERIARLRRDRGVSQTDLGLKVGTSQRVMSYYENGSTRIPAEALLKIADVLKVSVYEILGRAAASPRAPKSKKLWKVLEKIESLAPHDQKVVLRYIDAVAKDSRSSS
jgi:transcriptional regulator with XRE-family HTH domain